MDRQELGRNDFSGNFNVDTRIEIDYKIAVAGLPMHQRC